MNQTVHEAYSSSLGVELFFSRYLAAGAEGDEVTMEQLNKTSAIPSLSGLSGQGRAYGRARCPSSVGGCPALLVSVPTAAQGRWWSVADERRRTKAAHGVGCSSLPGLRITTANPDGLG
ncbi:hypothetical protein Drorol1_Dr00007977 [Drosera rotundifolia]